MIKLSRSSIVTLLFASGNLFSPTTLTSYRTHKSTSIQNQANETEDMQQKKDHCERERTVPLTRGGERLGSTSPQQTHCSAVIPIHTNAFVFFLVYSTREELILKVFPLCL